MNISQHTIDPTLFEPMLKFLEWIRRTHQNTDSGLSLRMGITVNAHGHIQPMAHNFQFPLLYKEILKFFEKNYPLLQYSQITLHMNYRCFKHIDNFTVGDVFVCGFGDYAGGELVVETAEGIKTYNTRYAPLLYRGNEYYHWNNPILSGYKYSLCTNHLDLIPTLPEFNAITEKRKVHAQKIDKMNEEREIYMKLEKERIERDEKKI